MILIDPSSHVNLSLRFQRQNSFHLGQNCFVFHRTISIDMQRVFNNSVTRLEKFSMNIRIVLNDSIRQSFENTFENRRHIFKDRMMLRHLSFEFINKMADFVLENEIQQRKLLVKSNFIYQTYATNFKIFIVFSSSTFLNFELTFDLFD